MNAFTFRLSFRSARRQWTAGAVLLLAAFVLGLSPVRADVAKMSSRVSAAAFTFSVPGAELVITRQPFGIQISDKSRTGSPQGACRWASAPAFQLEGKWVAVRSATELTASDAGTALVRLALDDGGSALATVRPFGPDGFKLVIRPEGREAGAVRGELALGTQEEIYGFGEMWNGHVAQRGQAFDLWDRGGTPDECAFMPYFVSTANYAFFLDYGGRVHFDVGQKSADRIGFEAPAPELDLNFVTGDSIAATVRHFLEVVGLPQRPPRWAFKPWFWLMSDPDHPGGKIDTLRGGQFVAMVKRLQSLDIPVGVTWFEPPWQDARTSFTPNPAFSPDLKGLIKQLSDLGVHTLAWTVPYTTSNASNWADAVGHGYLAQKPGAKSAGDAVSISRTGELTGSYYNAIDYFNPEAAAWWAAQIDRSLDLGLAGYKLDAGQDLEADAQLHGGRRGVDVHNSYALAYNRVFFDALKARLGDDFLMIPRAAWVGSSAATNFKWPGDLAGTFGNNGLPSSVYSSLSLAFCGLPFVSTDIGGFDDQPANERVWLRWAQFGTMLPGMQTLHMPWWYSEASLNHFRFLTWLHTDLTPLWMTLAHEAAETGAPVVRPLVWTFQDDMDCWRVDDEFTVGSSLLVAPMLNSNFERQVYLPPGVWYDFWDEQEVHRGPERFYWSKGWPGTDRFPLFIREGAIIPLEVSNSHSGFGWPESAGYVTLAIWPRASGRSEFTLRDTEGPVAIATERTGQDHLTVSWTATRRNHLLRIHLDEGVVPTAVVAANAGGLKKFADVEAFRGGGDGWCVDPATSRLWIRRHNGGQAGRVDITLNATARR